MESAKRLFTFRRTAGLLLFFVEATVYALLGTQVMLKSEEIRPADTRVAWSLAEQISAFPAFYLGVDPFTGLVINATAQGFLVATLSLPVWPRAGARCKL